MTTAQLTILAQYHVSVAQLDRTDRVVDYPRHRIFYLVESESLPGTYYRVEWDGCLRCRPHTGRICPAAAQGIPCWHLRTAVCADKLYKLEVAQERQREQHEVEMTEAYQFEQQLLELEQSQRELDIYLAEVDRRDQERRDEAQIRNATVKTASGEWW